MEQVEADVERYWRNVQVRPTELAKIREDVSQLISLAAQEHEVELTTQQLRLERLSAEEGKLLQAHYAEAISLPLLQKEQKRIMGERAQAEGLIAVMTMETSAMERTLDEALRRVERCDEVYVAGGPLVRRELCFGLFKRIYLAPEGVVGSDLASPFAQILDPDLEEQIETDAAKIRAGRLGELLAADAVEQTMNDKVRPLERPNGRFDWEQDAQNPEKDPVPRGSNLTLLVGAEGLEPPTSAL